ncbi:hypothetical protein EV207_10890 [Scopulibacillus darangshiensis]|uniref:Uncharacterized protein n=1 Tax=Scopulibacillus darangshiensis TaxID=442528 RepID=A0A4R2P6E5_9BACL|nr:hypothetical protein [Scopulibacillus darangshiensis]TCP29798.1 hypothetical protein EV207_10890 [Scopulibacillus darangshiensis]
MITLKLSTIFWVAFICLVIITYIKVLINHNRMIEQNNKLIQQMEDIKEIVKKQTDSKVQK